MFDETKKSVESILTQRLSSPFYGTLIISWLIWNWKIIYLTIFISEDNITGTKIDYIIKNYNDIWHIVWFPLISTVLLLTVIPLVTNHAYWLDLIYTNWRETKKQSVEMKQLLTLEQSVKLREQIINLEKSYDTLLAQKDSEIEQLKLIIDTKKPKSDLDSKIPKNNVKINDDEIQKLVKQINGNEKLKNAFKTIEDHTLGKSLISQDLKDEPNIAPEVLSFYVSNDIIDSKDTYTYKWTTKGKAIYQIISNNDFNINSRFKVI